MEGRNRGHMRPGKIKQNLTNVHILNIKCRKEESKHSMKSEKTEIIRHGDVNGVKSGINADLDNIFKNRKYCRNIAVTGNRSPNGRLDNVYELKYCKEDSTESITSFLVRPMNKTVIQKACIFYISIFCEDILDCFKAFKNVKRDWSSVAKLLYNDNNLAKTLFEKFWIVTPQMFEDAQQWADSSSDGQQLSYIVFHPGDCRLFVQIPVYLNSYLGRKNQLDRAATVQHYIQMGFHESSRIKETLYSGKPR